MKHTLLILLVLTLGFSAHSQNAWFSALANNESAAYPLLGISEDTLLHQYHVLTYHEKNDSYEIKNEVYDSTMASVSKAQHTWKKGSNDKIVYLGSAILQKRGYAFFSIITESTLTNELAVVEFDRSSVAVKSLHSYTIKSISNTGAYKMNFSHHNKSIVVMIESMVEKGKNESTHLLVFDDALNKKSDLNLSFAAISKPNPVNKCFVSDKGDVYLIKKDREKTEYKFYLYAYNAELKGWNQRIFTISGKLISDIDACLNSSDEFIVAGFYNSMDVINYEGYFYYRFDNSLKPASKINQRFTSEFMANFIGKKAASKEDAVISGYIFEHLVHGPNDQIYLIAEKEEYSNTEAGKKYFYGDILYLGLNKDGLVLQSGAVKNKQETINDDGAWSSFNFAASKDTLHLFHNELNPAENKTKFGEQTFAGTYHSRVYNKTVTDTKASMEMIMDKDAKLAFHPQYVYHTSDNQLLFLLLSKDKLHYCIGKMELK